MAFGWGLRTRESYNNIWGKEIGLINFMVGSSTGLMFWERFFMV
jgi:hypothetical protein